MKRLTITLAAVAAALVPAVLGLWGNATFSQAVPVRVPASAQLVTSTATTTPSATRTTQAGDDHGGQTPRDQRTEPGDDRGTSGLSSGSGSSSGSSSSGSGTSSGSGSSGSGSSGSGSGHSGSDDSGSDDHGGHGSDG